MMEKTDFREITHKDSIFKICHQRLFPWIHVSSSHAPGDKFHGVDDLRSKKIKQRSTE